MRFEEDEVGRSVRCKCGAKVRIDEEGDDEQTERRESSRRSKKADRRPKQPSVSATRAYLPLFIVGAVGSTLVFINIILPIGVIFTLLLGIALWITAFVIGCVVAWRNGWGVPFDYLPEGLGILRVFIMVLGFGLYFQVWGLLCLIGQIRGAMEQPRKFVPWLGMQGIGFFMFFGGIVTACMGASLWGGVQRIAQNDPQRNFKRDFAQPQNQGDANNPFKDFPKIVPNPIENPPASKPKDLPREALAKDPQINDLLWTVKTGGVFDVPKAARTLAAMRPTEERPIVIARLAEIYRTPGIRSHREIMQAICAWADAKHAPVLIQLQQENISPFANGDIVKTLVALKAPETVPFLLENWTYSNRQESAAALIQFGSAAEMPVVQYMSASLAKRPFIDQELFDVLSAVGTEQSLPFLQSPQVQRSPFLRDMANRVAATILQRKKK